MRSLLLLAALLATSASVFAQTLTEGPPACRYAPPADLYTNKSVQPHGPPEWIGPCAAGKAQGTGVVRVTLKDASTQIFYGRLQAGIPVTGMFGDSEGYGYRLAAGFDKTLHIDANLPAELGQSPKYWNLAASAARVAAQHYATHGNVASAAFYKAQAAQLAKGPGE